MIFEASPVVVPKISMIDGSFRVEVLHESKYTFNFFLGLVHIAHDERSELNPDKCAYKSLLERFKCLVSSDSAFSSAN